MPTATETRALLLVTVIAVLGVGARAWRSAHHALPPTPAEVKALDAQIARVDSARRAGRGASRRNARGTTSTAASAARRSSSANAPDGTSRAGRPTERSAPRTAEREQRSTQSRDAARTPVDLDRATAAEIEALPWIGPALAGRIVASRQQCGAYGSLQALTRVYGIGDAMAKRLAPYVTFSGTPRPRGAAPAPGCASADRHAAPRSRGRSK